MSPALPYRWSKKNPLGFPEEKIILVKIKQRKVFSGELLNRFSPKRYPCIFLDQRLKTSLF